MFLGFLKTDLSLNRMGLENNLLNNYLANIPALYTGCCYHSCPRLTDESGMDCQGTHNRAKESTKSMKSHQKTREYIKGKSPLIFYRKKGKIMIFSVRKPQYFISDATSQRCL